MSWIAAILFLCVCFAEFSEGRLEKRLPSAAIVGTVFCHACFKEKFLRPNHVISGALVSVECKEEISRPTFREEARTDKHGQFRVQLPFPVTKYARTIEGCSVTLIESSEPFCAVPAVAASSSLTLKSFDKETHIFSAGFFTFEPKTQPNMCSQKEELRDFDSDKTVLPSPIEVPSLFPNLKTPVASKLPGFFKKFPIIPSFPLLLPLPKLPPIPNFPGISFPGTVKVSECPRTPKTGTLLDQEEIYPKLSFPPVFPANPFESPSSLHPNPLQTPSINQNSFQSPPPLSFPFPQIPNDTPPTSSYAPFPYQFQPVPGISRLHPFSSLKKAKVNTKIH